jgi:hypothetical protein
MKTMYPESRLPLNAHGLWERHILYTFESRERFLTMSAITLVLAAVIWAISRHWLFGILTAMSLANVYLGVEARAICRMIRRKSDDEAK